MANKNPFEILGLNPNILMGLSDEEIQLLVRSQYRALQRIHHPDMGGDAKKSMEINSAYNALTSSEYFKQYKKAFIKPKAKVKAIVLERELDAEKARTLEDYQKYVSYLAACFSGEKTVFNIGPCTLRIQDYNLSLKLSVYANYASKRGGQNLFYDLLVRKDGTLARRKNKKTVELEGKRLIGTVSHETIVKYGGVKSVLELAQRIVTREDIELKRLTSSRKIEEIEFDNQISPEDFQRIMMLITPKIKSGSMLFAINLGKEISFSLEGIICSPELAKKYRV